MNVRLFNDNDNGCETPNDFGNIIADEVRKLLTPLVEDTVACGTSLRDFQTIVIEEVSLLCAEERLRRGIKERKANREIQEKLLQKVPYTQDRPCLHDGCPACGGTGVRKDDSSCVHMISCPCPKCSSSFLSTAG